MTRPSARQQLRPRSKPLLRATGPSDDKGTPAEELGQVEPLAAQGAPATDEATSTAEQLEAGAAGAAEDASDAMTAAQRAAERAVSDVASDAADAAAAAQSATERAAADVASGVEDAITATERAAADVASDVEDAITATERAAADVASDVEDAITATQRAAADVASDVEDAMTATQRAAERMVSDVQEQATQAAASAVQGTAEAVAAAAAEAAGAASAVADAAGSAAAPARPQGQLSAPAGPSGSLSTPKPPAGALAAPAGSSLPPQSAGTAIEATASSSTESVGRGGGAGDRAEEIAAVKQQLVSMLASLDRGAAATEDQAQRVHNLVQRLELLGGAVALGWDRPASGDKPGMALLDGRWRLLYSSGFTSGSLGGRRPGPSFGSLPLTLGPVYQDIYTDKSELDNVVELFLRWSLASLPGVSAGVPSATARLRHTFKIVGANTIEITFEDTEVKLAGGLQGWLDNLPSFSTPKLPQFLQTPKGVRSARFDVVFLDETMRITRGDRDEVRVFLKGAV